MKRHKNGRYAIQPQWGGVRLLLLTMATGAIINWLYTPLPEPISPLGEPVHAMEIKIVEAPVVSPTAGMNQDALIDYYADKYTASEATKAHRKALLHCLYWKESRGGLDAHLKGDNGKAGGPFQFHEPTYASMRRKMIEAGLVSHLGTRYDFEDAVETTSWAISQGRQNEWGPILRGDCQ